MQHSSHPPRLVPPSRHPHRRHRHTQRSICIVTLALPYLAHNRLAAATAAATAAKQRIVTRNRRNRGRASNSSHQQCSRKFAENASRLSTTTMSTSTFETPPGCAQIRSAKRRGVELPCLFCTFFAAVLSSAFPRGRLSGSGSRGQVFCELLVLLMVLLVAATAAER